MVPVLAWHHLQFGGVRQNTEDVCKTEFAANVPFKVGNTLWLALYGQRYVQKGIGAVHAA